VNPHEGTENSVNAAGTQEPLATHVAAVVLFAGAGVLLLRLAHFRFVVAGSASAGIG
jgi:hypothetical protein